MSEMSKQEKSNAVIVRCNGCNGWLASTNPRFIDEHIASCSRFKECKNGVEGMEMVQERGYDRLVMLEPRIEHNQIVRCIVEVDGMRTKVIVSHIRRGKFLVLSTSVYEHRYLVGRIIDASDICAIIL